MAKKKKKKEPEISFGLGLGGLFKGIGDFIELVGEMAEKGEREVRRTGKIKGLGKDAIYGYHVRIGPLGKPKIKTFGTVRKTKKGPVIAEKREPLVDVFEEKDHLRVTAELPGCEKKDVKLNLKGKTLTVSVDKRGRKYYKDVKLPAKTKISKVTCNNGVLEVKLKKVKK